MFKMFTQGYMKLNLWEHAKANKIGRYWIDIPNFRPIPADTLVVFNII